MRWFPLALSAALCAPLTASAEPPSKHAGAGEIRPCPATLPGYECESKKTLWETAVRFEKKLLDEQLAHARTQVELERAKRKLAVRTSTTIRNLVVPPAPVETKSEGHSTWTLISSNVVTGVLTAAITAALASKEDQPQTIVVK